ncbi:MAG: hypothetical protein ACTSRW_07020 [Candidatus Helarchaeota archaeon]
MTGDEQIQCIFCGKKEIIGQKSIKFYLNWLEYEPDKWVCKDCKRKELEPRLHYYKLGMFVRGD